MRQTSINLCTASDTQIGNHLHQSTLIASEGELYESGHNIRGNFVEIASKIRSLWPPSKGDEHCAALSSCQKHFIAAFGTCTIVRTKYSCHFSLLVLELLGSLRSFQFPTQRQRSFSASSVRNSLDSYIILPRTELPLPAC